MTQKNEFMNVVPRTTGKGASIAYRKDRKVPAVIYGPKTKNMNCLIDEIFVLKHSNSKYESAIFQTQSDDKGLSGLKVMLKKIETHPVSTRPVHVDLYALDMSAKIRVHVPLKFEGTPVGTKEGGVLQIVLRDIEIECNPTDIPQEIKVDVSGVELNHSLHMSDLTMPAGVTAMTAKDRTLCTVTVPREETAEPAEAAPVEGAAAAPAAAPAKDKKD